LSGLPHADRRCGERRHSGREDLLEARTRRLTALYELTDKLQKISAPADVYDAALTAIQAALRCDRASLLLFDDDGVMRFVAARGLSERYRSAVEGHSPWRAGETDARPFGIDDVDDASLDEPVRTAVAQEGIRALAFVPLMSAGRVIGKFMVYYDRPHAVEPDELDLAVTFARQIAFGLERTRSEAEREKAQETLRTRARQQQAVARLGEFALRERDLQKLLDYAAQLVAGTLDVEYCKVLEILPGGAEFLLRAGAGWKEGLVGQARIATGRSSQAGYALMSDVPIVVTDLRSEQRFQEPAFLREHGVVSGMSCIIREPQGAAWGVIGTHATRRLEFTGDDLSFLVAVANILSNAIHRERSDRALQEADRRKDEFLATLSHELRNPLAPLRNSLHVLRLSGAGSGPAAPIHEMMERQVNHLVRLVDDLLEVSRINRGTFALRRERIEVGAVVRNALDTSGPLIQGARHHLHVTLSDEPLWIEGDAVRVAQVLSNLLNNAARYTSPGGNIWVTALSDGDAVVVTVRDDGAGIEPQALPRIFEMFNRGDRPSGETGLGIGLALARRVAEMHGGTVTARSEGPGRGSEFAVRLPAATLATEAPVPPAEGQRTLRQRRIMVVDDNAEAADSLAMLLEFLGADVRVARDGPSAVEAFATYDPAAVLLDIGMPGMDGYEVARQLRSRFADRRTLLVALTGWGQEEDRRRAREAGFDHHLIKPADLDTLQRLLASLGAHPHGPVARSSAA
jgi:signal transduction histidine kinase/ActR/RegA family two-component response regulator